jgi:hypothetical protein
LDDRPLLLDSRAAAQFLTVHPRRLADRAWRTKYGLPCVHVGGRVRFDVAALQRWLEARREGAPPREAA